MKKSMSVAAVVSCVLLSAAHAQTVYRCGSAYSQLPCGQGKVVEVDDSRSPAQQSEAQRVADDEHRLAAEMRRDRLADQRSAVPAGAVRLSGPLPPTATTKRAALGDSRFQRKHAIRKVPAPTTTTDFVAFDPTSRKRRGGD